MPSRHYLAIDLGAESGRVMLGTVTPTKISLREIHRFPNISVKIPHPPTAASPHVETWHWDILRLWHEIQLGLAKAAADCPPPEDSITPAISGIGIDTWGVDFALLAENGTLLANPVCYRDARTTGLPDRVHARIPKEKIYALTGIQSMFFNTIFQLASLSLNEDPIFRQAHRLLFIPDLLAYWLTGRMANEYTIASTTMLLDAKSRTWSPDLLEALDIPRSLFPDIIFPATPQSLWGTVLSHIGEPLGPGITGIPVFAVGSHDTASAVAAIPTTNKSPTTQQEDNTISAADDWLYLSSGTWSLMGVEVHEPILTPEAFRLNLTNEGGIGNTIRLLKNVAGMWLLQECRREWIKEGKDFDYAALTKLAEEAPAHSANIDPDDPLFQHAGGDGGMPAKIVQYCQRTGQPVPTTPGHFVRIILESLAVAYTRVQKMLEQVTHKKFSRLHIVGGGSQNNLLNQMTADATGLTVIAGPVEATALGNIISQAISTRQLTSLRQARQLIADSCDVKIFTPRDSEKWHRWTTK